MSRLVYVAALKSFDDYTLGEFRWVYMTPGIASLVAADYFKVIWDPAWEVTDGHSEDLQDSPGEEGQGNRDGPGTGSPPGD